MNKYTVSKPTKLLKIRGKSKSEILPLSKERL